MGVGEYDFKSRGTRTETYKSMSSQQIFNNNFSDNMNPKDIMLREARDSEDHPESLPIIFALDVTGSMGIIPEQLVKDGLPHMMSKIIQAGIADPALLFMGVGDHEYDTAPLQVGQFESNDELLDAWLTEIYIERGGGANAGESYLLAWLFTKYFVQTDHYDKRKEKGFIFTVGDEPFLTDYNDAKIFSTNDIDLSEQPHLLLEQLQEKYHVFHIHITQTYAGGRESSKMKWMDLLGDNCILCEDANNVPDIVAQTIVKTLSGKESEPVEQSSGSWKDVSL